MNIPKAIEIQEKHIEWCKEAHEADVCSATRLGIEAMKFRLQLEQEDPDITLEPLPGETKD